MRVIAEQSIVGVFAEDQAGASAYVWAASLVFAALVMCLQLASAFAFAPLQALSLTCSGTPRLSEILVRRAWSLLRVS